MRLQHRSGRSEICGQTDGARMVFSQLPRVRDSTGTSMTATEFARLIRHPFEWLFDALIDQARRERTMVLLLTGYAAVWTVYATISKSSQDIHFDMGELVAWSREVGFGTPKHPPLAAWL